MSYTATLLGRATGPVHISVSPLPKNLSESKQILSSLQRFGEVVAFRNLQYDVTNTSKLPRPILAMFESTDAAQRAIASSPVRVTLTQPDPPPQLHTSLPSLPSSSAQPSSNTNTGSKILTCTIQESTHNYGRSIQRNPFHSTYNIDKESPIYADMTSPETAVPLKELAEALQRPKKPVSPLAVERIQEANARMGGHSLMELWREGFNAELENMKRDKEGGEEEEERDKEKESSPASGFRRISLGDRRRRILRLREFLDR